MAGMSIVVVSVILSLCSRRARACVGLKCSEIVREIRHRSLSSARRQQAPSNASRGNDVVTVYNGSTTIGIPRHGSFPSPYNFPRGPGSYSAAACAASIHDPRASPSMNDVIAGRYELRTRISKGGMGAVWRARDRRLRRDVAVKLLHAWIAEDPDLRARFGREARVLAPLENEHVVRLYDYGEDGESPFLVMELVEGANLGDVARGRVFSWTEVAETRGPRRDSPVLRPRPGHRPS